MKNGHYTLHNVDFTLKLEEWSVFAISYGPFDPKLCCQQNLADQMDRNVLQMCIPFQFKNHATQCLRKRCRHLPYWQIFDIFDGFLCVIYFLMLLLYMEGSHWGAISMLAAQICFSRQPTVHSTLYTLCIVHCMLELGDWSVFRISYGPFDTKLGRPRNLEDQMDPNE